MEYASFQAWLVDLDGTLYDPRGLKLVMAAYLAFHPGSLRLVHTFRKQHERLREEGFESEDISAWEEQVARTAAILGESKERVGKLAYSWMVEIPCRWVRRFRREHLMAEIAAFRAAGGKTALVSDYPATAKLRALEAEALFDVVIANGEPAGPGALKPSPAGYLEASRRLGIAPAACLVVGDRDDADGEAARRAQMAFRLVR
ncbi:MAG TPA: HAD-IA family hydrolase [Polyangiaceae bacterium]|jgi:HAD superfamily hydrolase (TIGR01549 family)|nr:MAG: fructose-1-P/6-phosphogluconate phosphatase [Deltaproteobacteria bacterium ADurb.Bin207]HNS99666.1 HAD-IA family hydrolase [Polyangiaceae bacterium]HNZ21813.1 HAD-IA family hydrolase [Polyangiaceae bacterium]HOD23463.1 HAD-IA family hydrolase [Polyangiaceae bacterium]HOE50692.1 HAD-IA family hydrolase [Polyangiaceae bacterium]